MVLELERTIFSLAPEESEKPRETPADEKIPEPKTESLSTLKLKSIAEGSLKEIENHYGKGAAALAFGSKDEANVVAFANGVLAVPETGTVIFSKYARGDSQRESVTDFLSDPWYEWAAEAQHYALNLKLKTESEVVKLNDFETTSPSTYDVEEEGMTIRNLKSYADKGGENLTGITLLESDKNDGEFTMKNVLGSKTLSEEPDLSEFVRTKEYDEEGDNGETLGARIVEAVEAINRNLPKWDRITKNTPDLENILSNGGRTRLIPVMISPEMMVFDHPKSKRTIMLVSSGQGKKDWVGRYFRQSDGDVAQQVNKWLYPSRYE